MYAHIHKSISTTCMHSYTITNPYLQHVCTHTQFHIHNIYAHIHAYTSTTCMHTYSHTHLQHVISGFFDVLFRFCFRSRWLCNWCKVCREGVLCCRVVHTHTHTHTHTFSAKICTQCQLTQTSPAFPLHGYGVVCVSWLWVQIFVRQETTWSWWKRRDLLLRLLRASHTRDTHTHTHILHTHAHMYCTDTHSYTHTCTTHAHTRTHTHTHTHTPAMVCGQAGQTE